MKRKNQNNPLKPSDYLELINIIIPQVKIQFNEVELYLNLSGEIQNTIKSLTALS